MNNYLNKKEKVTCCGCGMCIKVCPMACLSKEDDEEGFMFPVIDRLRCISCGKCVSVCPMEQPVQTKSEFETEFYAATSFSEQTLVNSSSGGMFTEFAKIILKSGGAVCGATIDQRHKVYHMIIDSIDELYKLQGSKYVQSDLSCCLEDIHKYLQSDKLLLFVGTPCQVYAVKKANNCDNLITVDLLCHGVPSQKLFNKYIAYLEKKHRGTLVEIAFRDKVKNGWSITQRYTIKKRKKEKTYYLDRHLSEYFSGYLGNMTQRESCYRCPFTTINRCGDITLADFWGIDKVRPELLNRKGTSLVLINTKNGKDVFIEANSKFSAQSVTVEEATVQNIQFFNSPNRDKNRDVIYGDVFSRGFRSVGKKYMLPSNWRKYRMAELLGIRVQNFKRSR